MISSERYNFIPPSSENVFEKRNELLNNFVTMVRKKKANIVISTTVAGAGHLRQAIRLCRFFSSLELENRIIFVVTDRTKKRSFSISDIAFRVYPWLQKKHYRIVELLRLLMNTPLGARIIDKQVEEMAKQGEQDMMGVLENSEIFNRENPTIFIATHSMLAGASDRILKERNNPDDWVIEFVPDPWEGSDLRSMTVHPHHSNWITVLHDENTVEEYRRIRPNSKAIVAPWGTLSNAIYLERRRQLELGEIKKRKRMDVIVEFSGNYIPKYDKKIISFILANIKRISSGEIRLVIDPMHHEKSYQNFKDVLERVGLADNPNVLLLRNEIDIVEAVNRREDVLEGKNCEVNNYFKEEPFDPFAVIAKGGEVPLEDRFDMIAFCPFASVPHEVKDIIVGVKEGRAIDARQIDPSDWMDELRKLFEEERSLPIASLAILAPVLIYIAQSDSLKS